MRPLRRIITLLWIFSIFPGLTSPGNFPNMKKNTTTLKIKKETHDKLMALLPRAQGHTWIMLGANRLGTIVDCVAIDAYDVCNTPGIEAKAMTKAAIALIKKKRSLAGFYIIPGKVNHSRSGIGGDLDVDADSSAAAWYNKNYYALGMMQGKPAIYVKRSLSTPDAPTAILALAFRKVQQLAVEIVVPKPRAKKVKQPAEQPATQVA